MKRSEQSSDQRLRRVMRALRFQWRARARLETEAMRHYRENWYCNPAAITASGELAPWAFIRYARTHCTNYDDLLSECRGDEWIALQAAVHTKIRQHYGLARGGEQLALAV